MEINGRFYVAMKSTWCQVNGEEREIFKDPKTDNGTKKSLKGLITVNQKDGIYFATDQCNKAMESSGHLRTVFKDGVIEREMTLSEIRQNVNRSI